ncbi:hypothetical protein [Paenilisteria rocourtiae]|uniref:Uncharacterized protein n=1 Tax=Listeria rocourtiae TaxID=647910 RepID=A0A4R6ZN54_9LIST|nr:hypothetical protein [Listeria rocourtiae]TDR53910.1 hypothetical protein DFP96_1034 [Listeria rocourtiae]
MTVGELKELLNRFEQDSIVKINDTMLDELVKVGGGCEFGVDGSPKVVILITDEEDYL